MGRPFSSELNNLQENIAFAHQYQTEELRKAINRTMGDRIVICGAGGSFSAASLATLLFEDCNQQVQVVTPLHFLQLERPVEPTTLLLFSAGGRNKDVLSVIQCAIQRRISIILVCAATDTPAAKLVNRRRCNKVFELAYPAKKDGFLAVNSLVVTWWVMARAFGFDPPQVEAAGQAMSINFDLGFIPADRRHVCLILHDRWTAPVAIDLESKLSEAGLCASLVSDWRQFGHGRHNWLAKNLAFTSVLAVDSEATIHLANRTLQLLPSNVPKTRLSSEMIGIAGTCDLLLRSFAFIAALGRQVGIDPGRPGVPAFGSAIYRLRPALSSKPISTKLWDVNLAAQHKAEAFGMRGKLPIAKRVLLEAANKYLQNIKSKKFAAVILDFDGTTVPTGHPSDLRLPTKIKNVLTKLLSGGIVIGIATGRGDSCHENLIQSFPKQLWTRIIISHYNGASIANLSDIVKNPVAWPMNTSLATIAEELASHSIIRLLADLTLKGPQITVRAKPGEERAIIEKCLRTVIAQRYRREVRLVVSSHTLDIVPIEATKGVLYEYIAKHHAGKRHLLTIGDRGDICGNDFELLSTPFSLSVDRVSADLESCWNFLPPNIYCEDGTAQYLESCIICEGCFQLGTK